jgi:hypothetical protein
VLTAKQIEEIRRIIREHTAAIVFQATGVVPLDADLKKLKAEGIIDKTVTHSALTDAYIYGLLSEKDPDKLKGATPEEILEMIRKAPLSFQESRAADWLAENAGIYCQGLGNRIEETTMRIIHDAMKERAMLGAIQETLARTAEERKTRSEMVTALRDATGDMRRDWQRIVNTELHTARTEGTAASIRKIFGGDPTVFVRPNSDACETCHAAYLETSGRPKLFKLSQLEISNIGRKTQELRARPGKPPLHPHCYCQLQYFNPDTMEFDEEGRVVFKEKEVA